jgi:hypothetical protein
MRALRGLSLILTLAACSGDPAPGEYEAFDAPVDEGGAADGASVPTYAWSSVNNVFPTTQSYRVDANYNGSYCELWLNGFGRGNFANGGTTVNWIEAYISTPPQWGEVLGAGMYVRTASGRSRIVFGREIDTDYWQTGYMTTSDGADQVAFFVDVEWPDGTIARLWQSDGGYNFLVNEAFALPPSGTVPNGGGSVVYANTGAEIFAQKRYCD